jgi:hypothetical protein
MTPERRDRRAVLRDCRAVGMAPSEAIAYYRARSRPAEETYAPNFPAPPYRAIRVELAGKKPVRVTPIYARRSAGHRPRGTTRAFAPRRRSTSRRARAPGRRAADPHDPDPDCDLVAFPVRVGRPTSTSTPTRSTLSRNGASKTSPSTASTSCECSSSRAISRTSICPEPR